MKVIEITRDDKQVAVVEIFGPVMVGNFNEPAKLFFKDENRTYKLRPGSDELPHDVIEQIAEKIYQGQEIGETTDGLKWRAANA